MNGCSEDAAGLCSITSSFSVIVRKIRFPAL
jgi:hypothetical protein